MGELEETALLLIYNYIVLVLTSFVPRCLTLLSVTCVVILNVSIFLHSVTQ